ncbi:MAG TPA: response regulator transcription factor [Gemmatimonadaceae bacterium]|nr:response regulator transcription factor [Gemmatimonadaceae bacterium]
MSARIRVLMVDDHAIVRAGLRMVLQSVEDFEVVGEAETSGTAVALIEQLRPDVVLLDINLPDGSGLEVAARCLALAPATRILMLSVHDDREFVRESVRIGAHGFLRKDTTPAELRRAIRAVHSGDAFFSPPVARRLSEVLREELPEPSVAASLEQLTTREREVLVRIAQGLLNKEIAAELGISVRTVESHRDSLMRKLGLRTVAALTRFALEAKLLPQMGDSPTRAP